METKIRDAVIRLSNLINAEHIYLAGGALCKHETNDYDLLIFCGLTKATILARMEHYQYIGVIDDFKYHEQYDDGTDVYHSIYNVQMDGIKFDFLFVSEQYSVAGALKRFPLSIQRRAENVDGFIYYEEGFQENPIIVYEGGRAERKYRKYYPDTMFINPDGTERMVDEFDIFSV